MDEQKNRIPITTRLMPAFYRDFRCLMGDCRDNCCVGNWRIEFDKKDYLRLRRVEAPEEFKQRLDGAVTRLRGDQKHGEMYGCFRLEKGSPCPLQDPNGLCSLQLHCGEEALPTVCRTYPRKKSYTPAALEYALSPSCEGVLRLLWDLPEGVDFLEEDLPRGEQRTFVDHPENHDLMKWFAPVRSLCIDMLQNRALSLPHRIILLGLALEKLRKMDWEQPQVEAWVRKYTPFSRGDAARDALSTLEGDRKSFLSQNLNLAGQLLPGCSWVRPMMEATGWSATAREDGGVQFHFQVEGYDACRRAMDEAFGDLEYFFENLAVAVFFSLEMPSLRSKEDLWRSYVNFCNLYSFFRFTAAAACGVEPTRESLFHFLALASRALLHSQRSMNRLQTEFFEHESATLAHMAILVSE